MITRHDRCRKTQRYILCGLLFCLLLTSVSVAAQESTRKKAATKDELRKALLLDAPKLQTKGVNQSQKGALPKGFNRIADNDITQAAANYDVVAQQPIAELTIHFGYNSAEIHPDSYEILQGCAELLQEYSEVKLLIAGHTDSIGGEQFNLDLSQRRARSIQQHLTHQHQVAADRLFVEGYGKTEPIETNDTAWGRAENRRVEFIRYQ